MYESFNKNEVYEMKNLGCENYKDIHPQGDISPNEAKEYLNEMLIDRYEGVASEIEYSENDTSKDLDYESKENHDIYDFDEAYEKTETREELTNEEKQEIKKETGYSDEIIDYIENMDQYNVYKEANLHEAVIDGRKCLVKDIDMDYMDPKTEKTNRELMEAGRSPLDSKTGEKIELHHMGQEYDSPFAELCENSEHGDGKHAILHTNLDDSWRRNPALERQYDNKDRPNHWKERAQEE